MSPNHKFSKHTDEKWKTFKKEKPSKSEEKIDTNKNFGVQEKWKTGKKKTLSSNPQQNDPKGTQQGREATGDGAQDGHRILRESLQERLRLYRKTWIDKMDDEDIERLAKEELAAQEKAKENRWWKKIKEFAAKSDTFAAAHTMPKHQVCIYVATVMIPLSILCITWDLLAIYVFQIPHFSTINAPGFILFINFIAMPLAMYGYMMEYLMFENSRLAVLAMICAIIHPVLFFIRAYMEYYYDGFRHETKLYFENHHETAPIFHYPKRVFDPQVKSEIF